jgi:hypothetical protein
VDAIPWYRSPVFVSILTAFIAQAAHLLGASQAFSDADAQKWTDFILNGITLGSLVMGAWKRYRSNIQPLAISKPSAAAKSLPQCHPVVVLFAALATCLMFSGCEHLGVQEAQTVEQKAAALLGDFNNFQKSALIIGEDPNVPEQVRKAVLDAPIAVKPLVDQLDDALRTYRVVNAQLKTGQTTDDKLRIAAANLVDWVNRVAPQIKTLRTTIEGARP